MKRFNSGEALAKEMGITPEHLKKTFDTYNAGVRVKNDPFGKKVTSMLTRLISLLLNSRSTSHQESGA
jgi:hypothetical protein